MASPSRLNRRSLLLSVLLTCLIVLLAGGMAIYALSDPDLLQAFTIMSAAKWIADEHADNIDSERMIQSARSAMMSQLDRYSGYVSPAYFERMDEQYSGGYSGIGISVLQHDLGLMIISVVDDGPADQAGLKIGDIMLEADSVSLVSSDASESVLILRGKSGTDVGLKVLKAKTRDTVEVTVNRQTITFSHVPYAGLRSDSILYIRLNEFQAGAASQVEAALDSLVVVDGGGVIGLLLDLRDNPGGSFDEAIKVSDLFLNDGQFVVGTDGRSRWHDDEIYSSGRDRASGLPMVVLVNRNSASASEIVAGSLQSLGRAKLVGDTTFGKGLVQGFIRYPDGDGLRLTIARYYFQGRVYLNEFDSTLHETGRGLAPDYLIDGISEYKWWRGSSGTMVIAGFVGQYAEAILSESMADSLGDIWIERLYHEAHAAGLVIQSSLYEAASLVRAVAILESGEPTVIRAAQRLVALAQSEEKSEYRSTSSDLKRQLMYWSYRHTHGSGPTYRDMIVESDPAINAAAELMKAGAGP